VVKCGLEDLMRHSLLVAVILATAGATQAAGTGQKCKVPTNNPAFMCAGGDVCLQAIGSKYCSNPGKICGWPDKSGYPLGKKKQYGGKKYECFANGFMLALGEECKVGTSERKFLCPPGSACLKAIGKMYCSAPAKVCGWPGTSGYPLGHPKQHKGNAYACFANGFKPAESSTSIGGIAMPPKPKTRRLNKSEITIAVSVFKASVNPSSVRVSDSIGTDDRPWTAKGTTLYTLNVGKAYPNLAKKNLPRLLVHELVHVWQGQPGVPFTSNSALHQTLSVIESGKTKGAYEYTPGQQWSKYNSEQQASIVEDWYVAGMKETSKLYPYIRDNVLPGQPNAMTAYGR
jgi:hypothetical protein